MRLVESKKFFCPECNLYFCALDKNGRARCPICGKKRKDNFNQIGENRFQCIICGCTFLNVLKMGPICPNGCGLKR